MDSISLRGNGANRRIHLVLATSRHGSRTLEQIMEPLLLSQRMTWLQYPSLLGLHCHSAASASS